MPFPQGGDFVKSVSSLFKIVSSDRRICINENGTNICNAGHKLKFPGTCVNQDTGTFNSTDPTFQPTFPICLSDYNSSGFSNGILAAVGFPESSSFVLSDSEFSADYITVSLDNGLLITHPIFKVETAVESGLVIAALSNTITSYYVYAGLSPVVASYWQMAQFNPGAIYHGVGVDSPLFAYDVASYLIAVKRLSFNFIETLAAALDQRAEPDSFINVIPTDYYSTISGSEDICVGDNTPPYITLHSQTASGITLAPVNQIVDISVSDAVAGVDISTVFIRLYSEDRYPGSGIQLVSQGIDQTGGSVSITGDSHAYRFTYNPPHTWFQNELVIVSISGSDLPPMVGGNPFYCGAPTTNGMYGEIMFQVLNQTSFPASLSAVGDTQPPYISYTAPVSGTINNTVFTGISLKVADTLTGVDLSTLEVLVDTKKVVDAGVPTTGETSLSGTPAEYTISYTPAEAFDYGSIVEVSVRVADKYVAAPNLLDTSYTVGFIDDSTLKVLNFLPAVGVTTNLPSVNIEVDITDDTYGVNTNQCYFVINGVVVSGTQVLLPSGVHLSYHPSNDFNYGVPINVVTHAVNNNSIAPVILDIPHTLYYGFNLTWYNNESFQHDVPVNVFVQARNKKVYYKHLNAGYFFNTYVNPSSDFGASIEAINPKADLTASLTPVAPEHRYGEEVTVEFYIEDLEGNALGPYVYTYVIEDRP